MTAKANNQDDPNEATRLLQTKLRMAAFGLAQGASVVRWKNENGKLDARAVNRLLPLIDDALSGAIALGEYSQRSAVRSGNYGVCAATDAELMDAWKKLDRFTSDLMKF